QVMAQWRRYGGHVAANVGGVYDNPKTADQEGAVFTPVPRDRQKDAMAYLQQEFFRTPAWILHEKILEKTEAQGVLGRLGKAQSSLIDMLLREARLARIQQQETLYGSAAYGMNEHFDLLTTGIFEDWEKSDMDPARRQVQASLADAYAGLLKEGTANKDAVDQARLQLLRIGEMVAKPAKKHRNPVIQAHAADLQARIKKALDTQ
ncbi:MAG: zinc-dependent metalloprotease, partial [Saprospiraceae bacterium]|nr:zinc-dependent metalloprotease [Saprospiraceae bacterium]